MSEQTRRTRLLLVRHAQHDPQRRFVQHSCVGLTAAGVSQGEALAKRLAKDETLSDAVVLASRARRTIDTAQIVASALRTSVLEQTCDLCEMHPGAAEGLTYEEMKERYGPSFASVPGAEHFPDWVPRAGSAIERLVAKYASQPIIAITHNGVVQASFLVLGRMPVGQTEITCPDNTAITEWSRSQDGDPPEAAPVWRLDRFN